VAKITDTTLIPIGLAVVVIGGGAAWLTAMSLKIDSAIASTQRIEQKQSTYNEDISQIRELISGIHGELKRIKR
jgi:hypothetical protein